MTGAGPPGLSPPSTHTPQLNVLLEFADGIKAQLADMDEKLDALGDAVGAMHEDVKRLVGRPFLELYNEWKERTRGKSATQLPSEGGWAHTQVLVSSTRFAPAACARTNPLTTGRK